MPLSSNGPGEETDWEITPDGLYIATRHFLLRRGYCCANRCRNCPYVNWREDPSWEHAPASAIRRTRVSPKVLAGAHTHLTIHEQALALAPEDEQAYHREMIAHYRRLLEYWW
jgi:hypothetical protein